RRLVGLELDGDASSLRGMPLALDGRVVGRVTSCALSPALGRAIGLGWLRAVDGGFPQVLRAGSAQARVVPTPFYDPEGVRVRARVSGARPVPDPGVARRVLWDTAGPGRARGRSTGAWSARRAAARTGRAHGGRRAGSGGGPGGARRGPPVCPRSRLALRGRHRRLDGLDPDRGGVARGLRDALCDPAHGTRIRPGAGRGGSGEGRGSQRSGPPARALVLGGARTAADPGRVRGPRRPRGERPVRVDGSGGPGGETVSGLLRRKVFLRANEVRSRYDVVVVGGGVNGLAIAYNLAARHGIRSVAVFERAYIGSGASTRNTQVIRANYNTPETVPLYRASLELWRSLSQELDFNIQLSRQGELDLCHSRDALEVERDKSLLNRAYGVQTEILTPEEV